MGLTQLLNARYKESWKRDQFTAAIASGCHSQCQMVGEWLAVCPGHTDALES